jgi:hypothetical protein
VDGRTDRQAGERAGGRDDCGWGKKIINEKRLGGWGGGGDTKRTRTRASRMEGCVRVCVFRLEGGDV